MKAEQGCLTSRGIEDGDRSLTANDQSVRLKLHGFHIHAALRRDRARASSGKQYAIVVELQLLAGIEISQNQDVPHEFTGELLLGLRRSGDAGE